MTVIRAFELNAGCGGMSEGLKRAGIQVVGAIDYNADACVSYRANHGDHIQCRDIREWAREPCDVEFDLLVADPPCQPYSNAGHGHGENDERDLLRLVVDWICEHRPSMALLSNVPGLCSSRHEDSLSSMINALRGAGYCVDFVMHNGADFGLPQRRKRPWFLCHRQGPCVAWPVPTHCNGSSLIERPWVSVGEAMRHAFGDGVCPTDLGRLRPIRWHDATDHKPGSWDGVARTLTHHDQCDGALLWPIPTAHEQVVVLNEQARLVLQGFPSTWTVVGKTKGSRDSQIGLAMPPLMAETVGLAIVSRS